MDDEALLDALEGGGEDVLREAERRLEAGAVPEELHADWTLALAARGSEASLRSLEERLARGDEGATRFEYVEAVHELASTPAFRARLAAAVRSAIQRLGATPSSWGLGGRSDLATLALELVDDRAALEQMLALLPEDELLAACRDREPAASDAARARRHLVSRIDPPSAVRRAVDAVMKASADDPLGWRDALLPLARDAATAPRVKEGLERLMAEQRFGFPRDRDVVDAVRACGADDSILFERSAFEEARSASALLAPLVDALVEEGRVDEEAGRALRAERDGLGVLVGASLVVGIDVEAGEQPVPYGHLLETLAELAPFTWSVTEGAARGGRTRYALTMRHGDVEVGETLVHGGDHYDLHGVLRPLNRLRHLSGDPRQYVAIGTGGQLAFVMLERPADARRYLKLARLRRLR